MNRINIITVIRRITDKYGINMNCSLSGDSINFRPTDLEKGTGFAVRVSLGWRHINAEFVPDKFSGNLIRIMGLADDLKKELFSSMLRSVLPNVTEFTMDVNGAIIDYDRVDLWPSNWNSLYLKVKKMPIVIEELTLGELENSIVEIAGMVIALILPLLPLEEMRDETIEGLPEGAVSKVLVNKYERSSLNRQACILMNGVKCKVCEFDFEKQYGTIGCDFIHVHHVTPVSTLGAGYSINPVTDLVPVCPNCHAMLHKRNPPYSVDELKKIVLANKAVLF